MILRALSTASTLLVYFLAASLVAELIIVGYVWFEWGLDRDAVMQILTVARGVELAPKEKEGALAQEVSREQASYEEIVERRAAMYRELELREQALRNALDRLKSEERQLAEEQAKYEKVSQEFATELAALTEGAKIQGRDEVRGILEALRPPQAKTQLMEMLDKDEIDEVVILLSGMQSTKRAKILAEFKLDENKKVAEVLRLIREGEPRSGIAREARRRLGGENMPAGS
jgi:flagellar motility protein MotE (MotC chaperone)